jgi:hypothetical protein
LRRTFLSSARSCRELFLDVYLALLCTMGHLNIVLVIIHLERRRPKREHEYSQPRWFHVPPTCSHSIKNHGVAETWTKFDLEWWTALKNFLEVFVHLRNKVISVENSTVVKPPLTGSIFQIKTSCTRGKSIASIRASFSIRKKPDTHPTMFIRTLVPYLCRFTNDFGGQPSGRKMLCCCIVAISPSTKRFQAKDPWTSWFAVSRHAFQVLDVIFELFS